MKSILFANTAWYLFNFRVALARSLRDKGFEVVCVAPKDEYACCLENEGFRFVEIDMDRRSLNLFDEVSVVVELVRLLKKESPDLIHNFTIKPVIYGSLAAKLSSNVSTVNAIAGLGSVFSEESNKASLLRPFLKLLFKVSLSGENTALIVQNPDDENALVSKHIVSTKNVSLIRGSGVDGKKFHENRQCIHKVDDPVKILFASRLLWDKGVKYFVDVARELGDLNAEFLVAGKPDIGNPNAVPKDVLDQWNNSGSVRFLGHVEDMDSLLREVDIVVLPSLYGEGVPRILVESAASALPLVAFDVPGSREIVIDKVNGYLIPPRDTSRLKAAIEALIRNPKLRKSMGSAGREHFFSEYEESTVISKTLKVYEGLLNTRID